MIRTIKHLVQVLERMDKHLHVIARALEAEALADNSFGTDKQLYTKPKTHVRQTLGSTMTGKLKEDEPQCSLEDNFN